MMTRREFLVRTGAAAALAGFPGIAVGAAREPGGAAGRVLAKLKAVANSKSYYWAWTHPWMDPWPMAGDRRFAVKKGEGFAPLPTADVRLDCAYTQYTDGRRVLLAYSDLAAVTGTWHAPAYYAANRATLTAAIRRFWKECGGVTVFSWHMDHPYCETGFKQASYRYKSDGDDRNAIKQILDGTGRPCGTGSIDGKTHRTPFANPRAWYFASLQEIAAFFKGLVDEETGEPIPVILRYGHEMDGTWFWWGRTWCTSAEFRAFSRLTADFLRKACGDNQILFAYTPDRTWKAFGQEGDAENTYLACYPGDAYVDIVGLDDYSIGHGDDAKAEASFEETVRKLRLISAFAARRGKVAALTEAGGRKKRDDFWVYLHRVMTAEGVQLAFADTWGGVYGTLPETPASEQDERAFARRPEVLLESPANAFR